MELELTKYLSPLTRFFEQIYLGSPEGYVCFSSKNLASGTFKDHFQPLGNAVSLLAGRALKTTGEAHWWFCPHPFAERSRKKDQALATRTVWADLDELDPRELKVEPTILLQSSKGRYQGLWLLEKPIAPEEAEEIARRIAYGHAGQGADTSGWDLTQLLRVPFTYNHKYHPAQQVLITHLELARVYTPDDFSAYPEVVGRVSGNSDPSVPDPLGVHPETLLSDFALSTHQRVRDLYSERPEGGDWSRRLWELELALFEGGMSAEQVFWVCKHSACNKFERDGRDDSYLWTDILRAGQAYRERYSHAEAAPRSRSTRDYPLLTDGERRDAEDYPDFVKEYIEWAKTLGDAAWQYHQAGAFIILSTLLAGPVILPTSFGNVLPNLWFMILADTTLTRKSTAMDIAMDLVREVDTDCILATDGSIEGLLTTLSLRPRRPSVFLRDEFTGMLEMMAKRDYYAGMAETLTKLYDGKFQKRVLKRETITIEDPVLNFFAGGIKTRLYDLLTFEHVTSGFLPRFIFITAESDVSRLQPLGPPSEESLTGRDTLSEYLTNLMNAYRPPLLTSEGRMKLPDQHREKLTSDAWRRYNSFEATMLRYALDSSLAPELVTPMMDRLAKSGLKVATLLAASEQWEHPHSVIADDTHLTRAFYYIEQWRDHSTRIAENVGTSPTERTLTKIVEYVRTNGEMSRSKVMQRFKLSAREMDGLVATLEQRGLVRIQTSGKRGQKLTVRN